MEGKREAFEKNLPPMNFISWTIFEDASFYSSVLINKTPFSLSFTVRVKKYYK